MEGAVTMRQRRIYQLWGETGPVIEEVHVKEDDHVMELSALPELDP